MTALDPLAHPPHDGPETVAVFAHGGPRTSPAEAAGQLRARYVKSLKPATSTDLAAAAMGAHLWMVTLRTGSLHGIARFGAEAVRALVRCQMRAAGTPTVASSDDPAQVTPPPPSLCHEVEDLLDWACEQLGADAAVALRAAADDLWVDHPALAGGALALRAAADALDELPKTAPRPTPQR